MDQWYALHTRPNSEYQVARILRLRGLETYLPDIEPSKVHKVHKREPFFPCYLFMKVNLDTVSSSRWLWTPGLRRIVAYGDQPVPIPDEVISLMRHRLDEIETPSGRSDCQFKSGETVRIVNGPFRNMLAVFDKQVTSRGRVQILLDVLGRASRVRLDVSDLEKALPDSSTRAPKRPRRTRGRGRRIRQ